ncbi:MAG: ATP-binding cassette domain-containing protein [Mycobacteriales bacterium]
MTPPGRDEPVVVAEGLFKRYGDLVAVHDLSFTLASGTVTGFLGPNGAGKTTTLRLLLGLAEPTSGKVLVCGHRYKDLDRPARLVGAVLESDDFHPARSGRDHLRVLATASEIAVSRVDEVLALVGLTSAACRSVKTYSLGMRQRLGLAGALLGDPDLLILDEPANGLDPAGVAWLRAVLRGFADRGGTVLVSSHLLAEAARSVDPGAHHLRWPSRCGRHARRVGWPRAGPGGDLRGTDRGGDLMRPRFTPSCSSCARPRRRSVCSPRCSDWSCCR